MRGWKGGKREINRDAFARCRTPDTRPETRFLEEHVHQNLHMASKKSKVLRKNLFHIKFLKLFQKKYKKPQKNMRNSTLPENG